MANYLVTDTELTSIANAIRTKSGTAGTLTFPTQFISSINAIVGGPGTSDAILLVTYPQASTLTVSKSSTSLTAIANWITASDSALRCALFVISSSMFDSSTAWTVSISNDSLTNTKTVTISTNEVYSVTIMHNLYIIKNGFVQSGFTHTGSSGLTFTQNYNSTGAVRVYHAKDGTGSTYYYGYFTPGNNFETMPYTTLHVEYQVPSGIAYSTSGTLTTNAGMGTNALNASMAASITLTSGRCDAVAKTTKTVSTSSITYTTYFKYKILASSTCASDFRFFNVWLT